MELTQILSLEKWIELENELFNRFQLQGSVFNKDGVRITTSKNWTNSICPVIKSIDEGQSFICASAHMNMSTQAMKTRKPVMGECDAGMVKIVVPVFVNDEYLGVVGGCGLLEEGSELDEFAIHKITCLDPEKIKQLCSDIPTISMEGIKQACAFLEEQLAAEGVA